MADWRDYLFPEERDRLAELDAQAKASSKERRKIFDRARKRIPPENKQGHGKPVANPS